MAAHIVRLFGERNTGTRAATLMLRSIPGVRRHIAPAKRRQTPVADPAFEAAIKDHLQGHWRRYYLRALSDETDLWDQSDNQWKHAVPVLDEGAIAAGVKTLFMVRNPYSWLLALARRPYHMVGPKTYNLDRFIDRPWLSERRENAPAILRSPMQLWNVKLAGYLAYEASASETHMSCKFIMLENFIQQADAQMRGALEPLGVDCAAMQSLAENTKPNGEDLDILRAYYAREGWRDDLTRSNVQAINSWVDWGIAARFGYAKLDPKDFPEKLDDERAEALAYEMGGLARAVPRSDRKTGATPATGGGVGVVDGKARTDQFV